MKRLILLLSVVTISAMSAKAQDSKSSTVSIAGNIGLPTTTGYSLASGVDIQGDFALAASLKVTLSGGYENYHLKSSYGSGSFYFIPVLAGVKFPLTDKLYGHAQLGYGFAKGGSGAFGYAPSVGYLLSENFDLSLKYLAFSKNSSTFGSVNLRLAYDF